MKVFKTNSKEIINNWQLYFGLQPISDAIKKRKINFLNKISTTCNSLCKLFVSTASSKMITCVQLHNVLFILHGCHVIIGYNAFA